jgi:chromosome segregation ATPase
MSMLDQALHRGQEAAMSDAEKLAAMEAEVSEVRSLLRESAASGHGAARNIGLLKAAVAEQPLAHGRGLCALEEQMGRVKEAGALGQQESEVSGMKDAFQNLEGKHEQLQVTVTRQGYELTDHRRRNEELGGRFQQLEKENRRLRDSNKGLKGQLARVEGGQKGCNAELQKIMSELTAEIINLKQKVNEAPGMKEAIARQGDELVANNRWNEGLGGRAQQLDEENRRLRNSSEGLKGKLARVEAGQQNEVARLQEAIATYGSKVKEDLANIQRNVAKLNEDMMLAMMLQGLMGGDLPRRPFTILRAIV